MFSSNMNMVQLVSEFKKILPGKDRPAAKGQTKNASHENKMSYIPRDKVVQLIELIYRVQEAYYHIWDISMDGSQTFHKKDIQIVR